MAKNIVICCDGTSCEFGNHNSNVLKLYALLEKSSKQIAYYHPGLGTIGSRLALTKPTRWWTRILGLAFGYGLMDSISDAYEFLMSQYGEDDSVYFFGFSRGAYTVRALAALLHMFGLLRKGNDVLVPYILRNFRHKARTGETFELANLLKKTFSVECRPHFLGAWDTVSSVGWIYDPLNLPFTARNPDVAVCRHAISVDERRCAFRSNLWEPQKHQDSKQVWFPGSHGDIGGGYPENESGLSDGALRWMLHEARAAGLLTTDFYSEGVQPKISADPCGYLHNSMTAAWLPLEIVPRRYIDMHVKPPRTRFHIPLGRRRVIEDNSVLHESVEIRAKLKGYCPQNLPEHYSVERDIVKAAVAS